jgi:hypothetical protein
MPWDLHPALTEERLRTCARLLANARRDALAMASHELGDDAWSIGCRAYAFSRHRLQRAAEAGDHPWLRVLDASHHFVFLIDDVPVRFYRGAADDPTDRTLRRQEIEGQQLSLALGKTEAVEDGLVFRLAIETGEAGRVERVVFVALRGEADAVECFWPVPLEAEPAGLPGSATARGAVQLRLIADDGYEGPKPEVHPAGLVHPLPCPDGGLLGARPRTPGTRPLSRPGGPTDANDDDHLDVPGIRAWRIRVDRCSARRATGLGGAAPPRPRQA